MRQMTIWQSISLLWTRFTPLESRLLSEIRSVLPEAARPLYEAQIAAVTRSQRVLKWNEVCYYRMKRRRVCWAGVPLFPCTDEMELAEVRFSVGGERFRATLFSISGHIFAFHMQPGGRDIAFTPWDDSPEVRLLDDPMREPTGQKKAADLLPAWSSFLNSHDRGRLGKWTLHDATTAYSVSLQHGEFLILAEREGDRFFLQRLDPPSDLLYFLDGHDGTPEAFFGTLDSLIGEND
jgi:hypothetical protein